MQSQWSLVIGVMVVAWFFQAFLTILQVKAYRQSLRELSCSRSSGFLGAGVWKKWPRSGAVVVLITDKEGRIVEGRKMGGMTVWSKLKPFDRFNGLTLATAMAAARSDGRSAIALASVSAMEQIQQQMARCMEQAAAAEEAAAAADV